MKKILKFNVKWTFKDKNLQQSCHLKLLKIKKYILRKFQCTSLVNSSFNDALFIIIILTLFWHNFESTFVFLM